MPFYTHDNVPDSPINNFATQNVLTTYNPTLSDGNLYSSIGASYKWGVGTIFIPSTGKWIFEIFFLTNTSTDNYNSCGVITLSFDQSFPAASAGFYGINDAGTFGSSFMQNGTRQGSITLPANTLIQCIIDRDAGELTFTKDGTLQTGTGSTVILPNSEVPLMASIGDYNVNIITNFGQDPTFGGAKTPTTTYPDANGLGQFHYEPPAGALALCTANIPEGYIKLSQDQTPSDHFKAVTYTGQTVGDAMTAWDHTTGTIECGFPVDLAWIKVRNAAGGHRLYDTVRGANQILLSNETSEEKTFADEVTGFHSTGFYVGNASIGAANTNYVAWCFRAAGSPADNQAKIINEDGTQADTTCAALASAAGASNVITPSKVSANRQNGFSIVKYVGTGSFATVPHGLDKVPEIIIVKNLDASVNWWVYTTLIDGSYDYGVLNLSNSFSNASQPVPTLNIFTQSQANQNNIAYCWHSVAGYSKFGSYTGNGSADGPFVYTGFRPAMILLKSTSVEEWGIVDNARDPYNSTTKKRLFPHLADQENDAEVCDFLSNGFKVNRGDGGTFNVPTRTYIYMAFAEQPFSGPSNAR